jgi:hypothetical protein
MSRLRQFRDPAFDAQRICRTVLPASGHGVAVPLRRLRLAFLGLPAQDARSHGWPLFDRRLIPQSQQGKTIPFDAVHPPRHAKKTAALKPRQASEVAPKHQLDLELSHN